MRSKGLLLVLLCLLGTCVFYLMVGEPSGPAAPSTDLLIGQPQTQSLSSPTPAQQRQVPSPARARLVARDDRHDESQRLLRALGFTSSPRSYPTDRWRNVSLPVFSSVVQPAQAELAVAFIRRFQNTFPAHLLILHTVALDEDDFDQV